jgi:hypothetical protein
VGIRLSAGGSKESSLRGANGSRERAPDDRLREAIHLAMERKNGLLRRFAPLRKRFAFVADNDGGELAAQRRPMVVLFGSAKPLYNGAV